MTGPELQLDVRRRAVTQGGTSTTLQEKHWQVLSLLVDVAPDVVSRDDLINTVWKGNAHVGEKGLNQAIWAIRAALNDSAVEPLYIRTVPRVGYQWVHRNRLPTASHTEALASRVPRVSAHHLAALLVIVALMPALVARDADEVDAKPQSGLAGTVATDAYLVDRDIHVEFGSGCRQILKNASRADIGEPVLSVDGSEVAVTLRDPAGCRLVTIDVRSGERRDFGDCPSI